jgi:hypothetical protein
MRPRLRRLYSPHPVQVETGPDNAPASLDGVAVETVRERWAVDDRWWEVESLRRHYFELALADGRAVVVFRDLASGCWYRQRA